MVVAMMVAIVGCYPGNTEGYPETGGPTFCQQRKARNEAPFWGPHTQSDHIDRGGGEEGGVVESACQGRTPPPSLFWGPFVEAQKWTGNRETRQPRDKAAAVCNVDAHFVAVRGGPGVALDIDCAVPA